jgi:putative serine protease PepD
VTLARVPAFTEAGALNPLSGAGRRAGAATSNFGGASLGSKTMEPDDGLDDDSPSTPLLPPDDRLWRHPSEMHLAAGSRGGGSGDLVSRPPSGGLGSERSGSHRVWALAVVAGLVGALAASGVGMITGVFERQTTVVGSVNQGAPGLTLTSEGAGSTGSTNWEAIDDALAQSVVSVSVNGASGPASGSGVMFLQGNSNSYIITDSSLFDGGGSITVGYLSGETEKAHLIGSDPISGLALIAVPARSGPFPATGSVADLRVASPVLAIGARTSMGGSVFAGSITSEDRQVDVAGGVTMQNMIAATASQVPDSIGGGPLVDGQGRIVGVTVALDPTNTTDQGLVFAVPVDLAERIAQEMLSGAKVDHPWLGISNAADLSTAVAHDLGVSGGAQVGQIIAGGPASRVGLSANDIITSFNGFPVTSTGTLTRILSDCTPGRQAPISYIHDGLARTESVTVSNQPSGD